MALALKTDHDVVELLASAARTATGASTGVRLPGLVNAVVFTLDVTNAETDLGDTLDVVVETKVDGANWEEVCAFTQIKGDGGTKRFGMKVMAEPAVGIYASGAAVGAGNVRNMIGDEWRASWTVVDSGDVDQTFTFSVAAMVM